MQVQIRYFAAAREAAGTTGEPITVDPGATVADVAAVLVQRHPALAAVLPSLRFALAEEFVNLETPVTADATLALIPPVGGG